MENLINGIRPKIMLWGIGSYAGSAMRTLSENGAEVCCYLTRDYGDYGPSLHGETFHYKEYPNPCPLIKEKEIDLVIPMSINWHEKEWKDESKKSIQERIKRRKQVEKKFKQNLKNAKGEKIFVLHYPPKGAFDIIHGGKSN